MSEINHERWLLRLLDNMRRQITKPTRATKSEVHPDHRELAISLIEAYQDKAYLRKGYNCSILAEKLIAALRKGDFDEYAKRTLEHDITKLAFKGMMTAGDEKSLGQVTRFITRNVKTSRACRRAVNVMGELLAEFEVSPRQRARRAARESGTS